MENHELIERVCDEKKWYSTEGTAGVKNLCKLVRIMGYQSFPNQGQFAHDGAYGDLTSFLEDNPGCIEAIYEWIGANMNEEWEQNLISELPEDVDEENDTEVEDE